MSNIELFIRDECGEPCELARQYVRAAIEILKSEGYRVSFSEHNIDAEQGRQRYAQLRKIYPEADGLPLTVINGEPFYVGAHEALIERITCKVMQ